MTVLHLDEALLALFAKGDQEAFTTVYKRFYERVLHFARKYVSESEAVDITAESFVQLWRKKENFDHINSISSFLFVTTRNRCYDTIRRKKVRSRYEEELKLLMETEGADDFFVEQVRVELGKMLTEEINKLPVKMREVFMLSFKDGLKPSQIATQLNISVKTVSNQKLSAIKILRSALKQYSLETTLIFILQMLYLAANTSLKDFFSFL